MKFIYILAVLCALAVPAAAQTTILGKSTNDQVVPSFFSSNGGSSTNTTNNANRFIQGMSLHGTLKWPTNLMPDDVMNGLGGGGGSATNTGTYAANQILTLSNVMVLQSNSFALTTNAFNTRLTALEAATNGLNSSVAALILATNGLNTRVVALEAATNALNLATNNLYARGESNRLANASVSNFADATFMQKSNGTGTNPTFYGRVAITNGETSALLTLAGQDNPDDIFSAYVLDGNLWLLSGADGLQVKLDGSVNPTSDGSQNFGSSVRRWGSIGTDAIIHSGVIDGYYDGIFSGSLSNEAGIGTSNFWLHLPDSGTNPGNYLGFTNNGQVVSFPFPTIATNYLNGTNNIGSARLTNSAGLAANNVWVGTTNLHAWMANIEANLATWSNALVAATNALNAATNALALATNKFNTNFVAAMNGTAYQLSVTNVQTNVAPLTVNATNGTLTNLVSVTSNTVMVAGMSNTGVIFGMALALSNTYTNLPTVGIALVTSQGSNAAVAQFRGGTNVLIVGGDSGFTQSITTSNYFNGDVSISNRLYMGAPAASRPLFLPIVGGVRITRLDDTTAGVAIGGNAVNGLSVGSGSVIGFDGGTSPDLNGAHTSFTLLAAGSVNLAGNMAVSGLTNTGVSYFSNLVTISGTNSLALTNTGTNTTGSMSALPVGGHTIYLNGVQVSYPIYSRP